MHCRIGVDSLFLPLSLIGHIVHQFGKRPTPPVSSSPVQVVKVDAIGFSVVSKTRILEGEQILELVGDEIPLPNRFSVFVANENRHIDPTNQCRYLNHSCNPNARFRGRNLVALKLIEKGEQICFDYTETELYLHEPFACGCMDDCCRGQIG